MPKGIFQNDYYYFRIEVGVQVVPIVTVELYFLRLE